MAKEKEDKPLHELLPPVVFTPMGAPNKQLDQGNLLAAKQMPAFPVAGGGVPTSLTSPPERTLLPSSPPPSSTQFH